MTCAWRITRVGLEVVGAFFIAMTVWVLAEEAISDHRNRWDVAAERRNEYHQAARQGRVRS